MRNLWVLLALLIIACGEERTPDPPVAMSLAEGGELRVQRLRLLAPPRSFVEPIVLAHAFFLSAATSTDAAPLPEFGRCNDLRATSRWPLVLPRTTVFADLGPLVSLNGTGEVVLLERATNQVAPRLSAQTLGVGYFADEANGAQMQPGDTYTIAVTGAAAPQPNTVTMPPALEISATSTLTITRGEPELLQLLLVEGSFDFLDTIAVAIAEGPNGTVNWLCLFEQNRDLNVILPAEIFAAAAEKGSILAGVYRHELSGWQNRRFDRVTIDWHIVPYEVR